MEPTPCTCSCHQRSVTCDPCWRLHTVVREMRAMLTGARDQAAVMMAAHPSIKDWLEGKRDAYGDALTTLDIWAAHGGDAPVEAIEPNPEPEPLCGARRFVRDHLDGFTFLCGLPAGHQGRHMDTLAEYPATIVWTDNGPSAAHSVSGVVFNQDQAAQS